MIYVCGCLDNNDDVMGEKYGGKNRECCLNKKYKFNQIYDAFLYMCRELSVSLILLYM